MGIIHRDEDRIHQLERENEELRRQLEELQAEVDNIYGSFSYKAGHVVTSPLRACARLLEKRWEQSRNTRNENKRSDRDAFVVPGLFCWN